MLTCVIGWGALLLGFVLGYWLRGRPPEVSDAAVQVSRPRVPAPLYGRPDVRPRPLRTPMWGDEEDEIV